jgi:hypothetical protein
MSTLLISGIERAADAEAGFVEDVDIEKDDAVEGLVLMPPAGGTLRAGYANPSHSVRLRRRGGIAFHGQI